MMALVRSGATAIRLAIPLGLGRPDVGEEVVEIGDAHPRGDKLPAHVAEALLQTAQQLQLAGVPGASRRGRPSDG
jgi:hypothetical protein